jgi:glycosyltransferase involved in cell wall biosynthesis
LKVTLLIPTLNEIDGMKAIMPRVKKEWVDQVLIVDGGSVDGTVEYARKNGYDVLVQKTKGVLNAYIEALEVASGDVIVIFTPDGNCIPELIPVLLEKMKQGYDMVIVSRYLDGAKSYDDDMITAFGNWFFTKLINMLYSGNYTDTLGGFRAWKKDLFKRIGAKPDILSFEPYSAIVCAKLKLRVAEIPGDEPARIGGVRKMSPLINGSWLVWIILKTLFSRHEK